jgi:4-amino-4-deoxy-L-arabinose transferase-like glycosyltransferase
MMVFTARFRSLGQRLLHVGLGTALSIMVLLRLIHLEADPPGGLTPSGTLYTDEGWYGRNAVVWSLTGHWYSPGDLNLAVNYPVVPLAEALAFRLFGLSLVSARLVAVAFFCLLLASLYGLIRLYAPLWVALVACLALAVNPTLFAFSRLALNEIPTAALALASAYLGMLGARRGWPGLLPLAGAAFAGAVLAKAGWFALPAVLYGIARASPGGWKAVGRNLVLWAAGLGAVLGLYYLFLAWPYRQDLDYFNRIVVARVDLAPLALVRNGLLALYRAVRQDFLLYALCLWAGSILFLADGHFRAHPLLGVALLWAGGRWAMLATSSYQPPRYFLAFFAPLGLLLALMAQYLQEEKGGRARQWLRTGGILLLVTALVVHWSAVFRYLARPEFTWREMCADIAQRAQEDPRQSAVLLGSLADSIALTTGLPAVNDRLGTASLTERLERYRPTHYVSIGPPPPEVAPILTARYRLELLARYDVLHNYYTGQPVHLYALIPK